MTVGSRSMTTIVGLIGPDDSTLRRVWAMPVSDAEAATPHQP